MSAPAPLPRDDGAPAPSGPPGAARAPEPPAEAVRAFGDRLPVLRAYADLLAGPGVERGLLGPRESPRLWERHLLNCLGVSELLEPGQVVVDLGSGAGLPGLVLAAARPDLVVVLVEPMQRRTTFLQEAVEHLGLRTTVVRRARAEQLAGELEVDAVVARAVAPLERLGGWALPLLHEGGRLLAQKGEQAASELAAAGPALRRAGAERAQVLRVGQDELGTAGTVVEVVRGARPPAAPTRRSRPERGRAGRSRTGAARGTRS